MNIRLARLLEHRHFILYCLVLFATIRLAMVLLLHINQRSDAAWFMNRAISIASGQGYSEGGYPTAYWPVGYPGFLGVLFRIFGSYQIVGQLANVLLGIGSFFLVLALSRVLFRDEKISRLGVAILTLYPNNAAYTPWLLTETYLTFLVLLGTYLFLVRTSWWRVLLSGIVFGLAILTKTQMIFLPCVLALLRFLSTKNSATRGAIIKSSVALYIVIVATLVPWVVRNRIIFGEGVFITTYGGVNLLIGNNPSANGSYTMKDPLIEKRQFSVQDQVASDRRAWGLAIQWIKDNPGRFIGLIPLKIWHLWAPDGEAEWAYQGGNTMNYARYRYLFRTVRVANQIYYVVLILLFLASFFYIHRLRLASNWPYSMFPYAFAAYMSVISAVFFGQSRWHFTIMPWIIMTVAWYYCRILSFKPYKHQTDS